MNHGGSARAYRQSASDDHIPHALKRNVPAGIKYQAALSFDQESSNAGIDVEDDGLRDDHKVVASRKPPAPGVRVTPRRRSSTPSKRKDAFHGGDSAHC